MEQHTLIKNVRIANSPKEEGVDILVKDGVIQEIGKSLKADGDAKLIDGKGGLVSPGLFDFRVRSGDPGNELREDLATLGRAAAAGGVTGLAISPDTDPIIQSKSIVDYIHNRARYGVPSMFCYGAATEGLKGEELTELHDLKQSCVVGYSNADNPYKDHGVLKRLLQYTSTFNLPVLTHSDDLSLGGVGSVNESAGTISTGLKVRPAIAEYIPLRSQLEVLRYTGGTLHFNHISCKESVEEIRRAKAEGLDVTCDVSVYHLCFTDESTQLFDSNFKLLPPLRSEEDRVALINGVKDGTIDVITSDHTPRMLEEKKKEFDFAEFGAIGIQTMWSMYLSFMQNELSLEEWLKATCTNPRKILRLNGVAVEKGADANFAVIATDAKFFLETNNNLSRSINHPLWGQELQGEVIYTCNGTKEYSVSLK